METETFVSDNMTLESSVNENEFKNRVNGTYEFRQVEWFCSLAHDRDISLFIDVGAFDGYFGLHVANTNDTDVVMVEPSPEAHELIVKNYNRNYDQLRDASVNIIKSAVSDEEGYIDGGIGGCQFFEPVSGIDREGTQRVRTTTIERIIDDIVLDEQFSTVVPNPDNYNIGVKVDTEGYELKALKGIGQYWDFISHICVEFHPMYVSESEIQNTLSYLKGHGFNRHEVDENQDPFNDNCNIRFVR